MKLLSYILLVLLSLVFVGCGDSPTAPSKNDIPCAIGSHRVDNPPNPSVCVPN
jgi:hypothetical protein